MRAHLGSQVCHVGAHDHQRNLIHRPAEGQIPVTLRALSRLLPEALQQERTGQCNHNACSNDEQIRALPGHYHALGHKSTAQRACSSGATKSRLESLQALDHALGQLSTAEDTVCPWHMLWWS